MKTYKQMTWQEQIRDAQMRKAFRRLDLAAGVHLVPRRLNAKEQQLYPEFHAEEERLRAERTAR